MTSAANTAATFLAASGLPPMVTGGSAVILREGVVITPEVKEHLWSALGSLASAPAAERTLTGLSVLLQSGALKQAPAPCCVGGPWGRLLNAEA